MFLSLTFKFILESNLFSRNTQKFLHFPLLQQHRFTLTHSTPRSHTNIARNFSVVGGIRQHVAKVREFLAVAEINLVPVTSTQSEILHRYLHRGYPLFPTSPRKPRMHARACVETSTPDMTRGNATHLSTLTGFLALTFRRGCCGSQPRDTL